MESVCDEVGLRCSRSEMGVGLRCNRSGMESVYDGVVLRWSQSEIESSGM